MDCEAWARVITSSERARLRKVQELEEGSSLVCLCLFAVYTNMALNKSHHNRDPSQQPRRMFNSQFEYFRVSTFSHGYRSSEALN